MESKAADGAAGGAAADTETEAVRNTVQETDMPYLVFIPGRRRLSRRDSILLLFLHSLFYSSHPFFFPYFSSASLPHTLSTSLAIFSFAYISIFFIALILLLLPVFLLPLYHAHSLYPFPSPYSPTLSLCHSPLFFFSFSFPSYYSLTSLAMSRISL